VESIRSGCFGFIVLASLHWAVMHSSRLTWLKLVFPVLHSSGCLQVESKVRQQLDSKKKELAEFQAKYKIKVRNEADRQAAPAANQQPGKPQGVLA